MTYKNSELRFRVTALALSSLLTVNLLNLRNHPISGYVDSIYTHIPPVFWVLSAAIYCSAAFGLISSLTIRKRHSMFFACIILLNNTAILFAPYICGVYLMYGGDLPTHGGMILDISIMGKIDFHTNFYPLTHLLAYAASSVADAHYMTIIRSLAQYFTILLPVHMFVLARYVTRSSSIGRLAFVLASGFYFCALFQPNTQTTPIALSFLFLPMVIWLLLISREGKYSFPIALLLALTAFVFFHPLSALILAGSFLALVTLARVTGARPNRAGVLFFLCAYGGYSVFLTTMWYRYVRNTVNFLNGYNIIPGTRSDIGGIISRMGFDAMDLVTLFVKMFGHQIVLLVVSAVFVFSMVRGGMFRHPILQDSHRFQAPICVFAIGSALLVIQLAFPTFLNVSFFRFQMYALLFSPLFVAAAIFKFRNRRYGRTLIASIACLLFISSMLAVYPSPYIGQANSQVTYADLAGAQWILDKGDCIGLSGFFGMDTTLRLQSGLIPYSQFVTLRHYLFDEKSVAPDHFGYDSHETLWDTFGESRYLIVTSLDLVSYQGVYANLGRICEEDIQMAHNDSTANLIYDGGSYHVFLVLYDAD